MTSNLKMKKNLPKLCDFFIITILILVSIFLIIKSLTKSSDKILVQVDSETYTFPLSKEEHIYQVQGPLGLTSIQVKDKKVRIIDSPCPNKTCVALGFTNPIICLPNHVIVQIQKSDSSSETFNENFNEGDFDVIAE